MPDHKTIKKKLSITQEAAELNEIGNEIIWQLDLSKQGLTEWGVG